MQNVPVFRQGGFTLLELVVVVTVLALIATIAAPNLAPSDDKKLQVAAASMAAAMRFARNESIRTGKPHGFRQQNDPKRIRVVRLDETTTPFTLIYDVYNPIRKNLYDIDIDSAPTMAADVVTRSTEFRGTCNQHGRIYFDSNGTPWCADPNSVLLRDYSVDLYLGNNHRQVRLDGITGRVTVQ